jgi:hypothetical protein
MTLVLGPVGLNVAFGVLAVKTFLGGGTIGRAWQPHHVIWMPFKLNLKRFGFKVLR